MLDFYFRSFVQTWMHRGLAKSAGRAWGGCLSGLHTQSLNASPCPGVRCWTTLALGIRLLFSTWVMGSPPCFSAFAQTYWTSSILVKVKRFQNTERVAQPQEPISQMKVLSQLLCHLINRPCDLLFLGGKNVA